MSEGSGMWVFLSDGVLSTLTTVISLSECESQPLRFSAPSGVWFSSFQCLYDGLVLLFRIWGLSLTDSSVLGGGGRRRIAI